MTVPRCIDLERAVLDARVDERRRLARELNDGLGPTLTAIAHQLEAASGLATREPDAAIALLRRVHGETMGAIGDLRRFVSDLR